MPEEFEDLEEDETEAPAELDADDFKAMRRKANKAAKAEAEAAELRKQLAFRDAEVDLSHPVGKLLLDTWQGDSSVAAIRARAEELGCLKTSATPAKAEEPGPDLTAEERAASEQRQQLATGAATETGKVEDPNPYDRANAAYKEAVERGQSDEKALSAWVHQIFAAGANGDQRVGWTPERPRS